MKTPLLLALLLSASPAPARAEPVTIKLGTLAPAGSAWHEALKDMAQRWEEASGGQVKLRVYPGGTQGDEGDMIRKLGIGQLQAAAVSNVGLHDVVPEPQAFSAPLLFKNEGELECAFGRVKDRVESALERRGLVALQWSRVGRASFFCNAPFRTPAEMAKAKMFAWAGDPAMVKAWRTAGFQPVVLSSTDLVPALTTRMIDCVSNVPAYMLTTRTFEKARYLIDLPLGFLGAATVVRKETWERIAPEVRERLLGVAAEIGRRIDAQARRLETDAVAAMKAQGLEVVAVSPDDWVPAMERSWEVIRGEVVSADFFDQVKAARDACRKDVASAPGEGR
ncbi:MAG TPA: TRAP transporter substrate-binding protein DctP [Anaeromyxobacter sp.]|nr:TRAP transporter substrate-binding protein DctP [Anaeromyxobacter sp.]